MNHGRRIERAAASALALAALLSAALSTSAAHAAPQGLPGRIAYAFAGETSLRTIEGDGTRGKTAYDRAGDWAALRLRDPASSPDGRKLAFSGTLLETSRIGVIAADGQNEAPKTVAASTVLHELARPAWSADGKTISFQAAEGLFTVPADGGAATKIDLPATYKDPAEPAYSADGRLLAFSALDADDDRRVYVKNLENDAISQLSTGSGRQALPAFSPDSAAVAYVDTPLAPGGGFGLPRLAARPLAGGAPDILWTNQVEPDRVVTGRPAYAPDGSRIAFTVTKPLSDCPGDLMLVNLDGAANPHAIGCSAGSVDWALRTAQGVNKLMSALPGSAKEGADGESGPAVTSDEGRYAFFTSAATNLAAGVNDDNGKLDIFRRDLASGKTTLASADKDGKSANGESTMPVVDADGGSMAFRSTANDLVSGVATGASAVWLRNISNGYTVLVSRSNNRFNVGAGGDNRPLAVSQNGRYVLYSSTGTDVTEAQGETESDVDLFVQDTTAAPKVNLITAKAGSLVATGNGVAGAAFMSDDGQTVVFESTATDLVTGFVDHNGDAPNLYKRDLTTNTTTLLDGAKGSATEGAAGTPQLQGFNGQTVLFTSTAADVVDGFVDGNEDAADLYTRTGSTTTLISGTALKGANGAVKTAVLAADGSRVFFSSTATDLDPGFTVTGEQVWTRTLTGEPTLVTRGAEADHGADKPSSVIDASGDGAFVLITSAATDLTAPLKHHDDTPTLYRVNSATFEAEPVSASGDDTADKTPAARAGAISADGSVVAYTSGASNLIDGFLDGNGDATDAYAWMERSAAERDPIKPTAEILTPEDDQIYREGSIVLADYTCADEGASGLKSCEGSVAAGQPIDTSDTGEFTFTVTATDNAGNTTTVTAGYRVAAANKKLSLASRATGDGTKITTGNLDSYGPVFSADGRYLVFTSEATNLVADFIDGNGSTGGDVYRRDQQTGITEVVSAGLPRPADNGRPRGVNGDAATDNGARAISPDGRYVLFEADATDAIAGQSFPSGTQLYLRDMQQGVTTLVTHNPAGLPGGDADPNGYGFSRDGNTIAFSAKAPNLVADDRNNDDDVFTYALDTGALTLVSVESSGKLPAAGESLHPEISADGRRVVFSSTAKNLLAEPLTGTGTHTYWRDLETKTTKLVDRKWDKPLEAASGSSGSARISADGAFVLFQTDASEIVEGYAAPTGPDEEEAQLYRRDMTTDGAAVLVTAAHDGATSGTGGRLEDAVFARDGSAVIWWSQSKRVIADFVDHNDRQNWDDGGDLYIRRFDTAKAVLAAHGPEGANHGLTFSPEVRALSENNRFATVYIPTTGCDQCHYAEDVSRLDLKRGRFNSVIAAANDQLDEIVASEDGRRIAATGEADNLLDGFVDANGPNSVDVYAWYDAPPMAVADSRITGSLKLAFDASESEDSDGTIEFYSWSFGDGNAKGEGVQAEHLYPDEGNYDITLTIEDDGGNEVVDTFEVVAIKGILTTGAQPIDFIGVDKHLRCSVVRDGPLLADGGGACGTFVALDGKTYGPPDLIEGTETYVPVGQELSVDGDVTTLVTTVALGETGVKVRQTDAYKAGKEWYRTDVDVLNAGEAAKTATVYRAARCEIGVESSRRSIHDAATSMAGCDGAAQSGRLLAAWLPLSAGARRDAGSAEAIDGRVKAGQPLADTCACGAQPDPAAAIGWPVEVAAKGHASLGSLAAFGPDGAIPLTLAFKADKTEVQPLDDNAFTVTLRNPNAGERAVSSIAIDHAGSWDAIPGSSSGLTTVDPAAAGEVATWTAAMKVAGHGTGELRFGATHRSGQRTATSKAVPAGGEFANLAANGIADLGVASTTVVARSIEGSLPNTAITSGPTGATTSRDPAFKLEASKDEVSYECRFGDAAWAPCEGNPHKPGPLADGPYTLEARAVDGVGADETPARRTFVVDTAAPATTLSSGPRGLISDPRPNFFFSANEPGARFECRLEGPARAGAWFACENPYRPSPLADGEWTFAVKAIDAAGNEDPTPSTIAFTLDTTPPVTVIDGISAKVLGTSRNGVASPSAGGAGSTVALGADGAAGVQVACPATSPTPCEGTVGLATTPPTASASQVRVAPENTITLARAEFTAQPGQTVNVRLRPSMTVRNTVERAGRMAVFTTLNLGSGRTLRGSDVVLTPDPRTARLRDAGRTVKVIGGKAKLRLVCPPGHAGACKGTVRIGKRDHAKFAIKSGRNAFVRVPISTSTKRGKELSVLLKTRLAPSKRLTLTLRAQEARR